MRKCKNIFFIVKENLKNFSDLFSFIKSAFNFLSLNR